MHKFIIIKRARKYLLTKKHPSALRTSSHCISTSTTSLRIDNNVVDDFPQRTGLESSTNVISVLAQGGLNTELGVYEASQLLDSGYRPNEYVLFHLLRASSDLGWDTYCQQLHCYILKSGFLSNVFVSTALMGFYRKINSLADAHKMFVEIPQPSVVSWNSLISEYVQSGKYRKALNLFVELERSEIYADAYSFTSALAACGQLGSLLLGMAIHSKIVKYSLERGVVIANCLIDMYGKCGSVEDAIGVFGEMIDKDIISWNSVIAASARNGNLELAFGFLHRLPNPDTISYNEVINGIAQFGDIEDAIMILSSMPSPNSSSWNSILTGYVNRNRVPEALHLFGEMQSKDVPMDEYTFSTVLSGIAGLSALTWGMLIHSCVIKQGLDASIVVASALLDMYSKCGQVKIADSMFRSLCRKNLVTWNAMITGYARNGDLTKVIELFEQLKTVRDLKPDSVTFLNVLAACSHTDIPFDKVSEYFESMTKDYGIKPTVEHCCSMIRLMGQKGEVWRAQRMIRELGFGSYGVVWRALLSAFGACSDLDVARISAAGVIKLEGDSDYVYVMLCNLYTSHGNWDVASVIRNFMRERGLRKEAGCSWIEVENVAAHSSNIR